jgi:hypothetical protein
MVSVLIPFAGNDPHRLAALEHVTASYLDLGYEVCVGFTEEPWRKALAVHDALTHATSDLLVIADADCLCTGTPQAVQAVTDGAPWAIPHKRVVRLTEEATRDVYDGAEPHRHMPTTQPPYVGTAGGGIVALTRDTWNAAPIDPRFVGWGQEDESWAYALECLHGRPWRGRADLFHLYHPPQARASRRIGSEASKQLLRRYHAAIKDPDVMRELIEEGRQSWTPPA